MMFLLVSILKKWLKSIIRHMCANQGQSSFNFFSFPQKKFINGQEAVSKRESGVVDFHGQVQYFFTIHVYLLIKGFK